MRPVSWRHRMALENARDSRAIRWRHDIEKRVKERQKLAWRKQYVEVETGEEKRR